MNKTRTEEKELTPWGMAGIATLVFVLLTAVFLGYCVYSFKTFNDTYNGRLTMGQAQATQAPGQVL